MVLCDVSVKYRRTIGQVSVEYWWYGWALVGCWTLLSVKEYIDQGCFRLGNPDFAFHNRTRNPFSDFDVQKSFLTVDFGVQIEIRISWISGFAFFLPNPKKDLISISKQLSWPVVRCVPHMRTDWAPNVCRIFPKSGSIWRWVQISLAFTDSIHGKSAGSDRLFRYGPLNVIRWNKNKIFYHYGFPQVSKICTDDHMFIDGWKCGTTTGMRTHLFCTQVWTLDSIHPPCLPSSQCHMHFQHHVPRLNHQHQVFMGRDQQVQTPAVMMVCQISHNQEGSSGQEKTSCHYLISMERRGISLKTHKWKRCLGDHWGRNGRVGIWWQEERLREQVQKPEKNIHQHHWPWQHIWKWKKKLCILWRTGQTITERCTSPTVHSLQQSCRY